MWNFTLSVEVTLNLSSWWKDPGVTWEAKKITNIAKMLFLGGTSTRSHWQWWDNLYILLAPERMASIALEDHHFRRSCSKVQQQLKKHECAQAISAESNAVKWHQGTQPNADCAWRSFAHTCTDSPSSCPALHLPQLIEIAVGCKAPSWGHQRGIS